MDPLRTTKFDHVLACWDRLSNILSEHGVPLSAWGSLQRIEADTRRAARYFREQSVPDGVNGLELTRTVLNGWVFAQSLLSSSEHGFLIEALSYVKDRSLQVADPRFLGYAQSSRERDLLFEVWCGCIVSKFAKCVRLEDPPDLTFDYGGERVGIACKQLRGGVGRAVRLIRDGFGQLKRAGVTTGFVVINISDTFPHAELSPIDPEDGGSFGFRYVEGSKVIFREHLEAHALKYARALKGSLAEHPSEDVAACNGVLFLVQSAMVVRGIHSFIGGVFDCTLRPTTIAATHFPLAFSIHLQDLSATVLE